MKQVSVFHGLVFIVSFLLVLMLLRAGYCNENIKAWEKKIEALNKRAETTTDMAELMKIMVELQGLMQQMPRPGMSPGSDSFSRGNTPEEEVTRRIEAINLAYRDLTIGLARISPDQVDQGSLIPVPLATKVRGHIKVTGKDSDAPLNGWTPLTLQYNLEEDYVGYLVITDYYDPKRERFVDKRDYMIATISTDIRVPSLSGRQCVETHSAPFLKCAEWRSIDAFDVPEYEVYPAFYDRVVLGHSEDETVMIKIETPGLYFRSGDNKAGRGIGCIGATIEKSGSWVASAIDSRSIQWKGDVGTTSTVTPRCETGSNIELHMDVCNPQDFADMDKCMQLSILLEDAGLFLKIAGSFKDAAEGASSVDHLYELVTLDIRSEFPGVDLTDEEHLDKHAGGFNPCSSDIQIPDLCKGCKPRPLCRWEREALEVHEKTHFEDVAGDPEIRKLFCRSELYGDVGRVDREQATTLAGLEDRAYSEQARYLVEIIEEELRKNYECRFSTDFFVKLYQIKEGLNPAAD